MRRFKVWAHQAYPDWNRPLQELLGEWEDDYPYWGELHEAADAAIRSGSPARWDAQTVEDFLYALARDNESERIIDRVEEDEERLFVLAQLAIRSPERDARWQLASRLSGASPGRREEAEALLFQYADDPDEYVRRCALLALGEMGSCRAEGLAVRAWETGHEYQRIAALHVLSSVGSRRLTGYLLLALADAREHLVFNARQIQAAQQAA